MSLNQTEFIQKLISMNVDGVYLTLALKNTDKILKDFNFVKAGGKEFLLD